MFLVSRKIFRRFTLARSVLNCGFLAVLIHPPSKVLVAMTATFFPRTPDVILVVYRPF